MFWHNSLAHHTHIMLITTLQLFCRSLVARLGQAKPTVECINESITFQRNTTAYIKYSVTCSMKSCDETIYMKR